jgi:hypothetical protein
MTINPGTINEMLSGNITLASSTIRSLITREGNVPEKNYVVDFPANTVDHISLPFTTNAGYDTGSHDSTKGVYLSANSCLFTNITADYTNSNAFVYNYIDTGDVSTSRILSFQSFFNPSIIGTTTFRINDDKLINLLDGEFSHRALYRDFRINLLGGTFGNIATRPVACGLLSSSYIPDIEESLYQNISAHVVTSTIVNNVYISDGALKTELNYITLPESQGVISTVIFYISGSVPENNRLIGYYTSGDSLTPASLSAVGNNLYVRLNQNTIFDLV